MLKPGIIVLGLGAAGSEGNISSLWRPDSASASGWRVLGAREMDDVEVVSAGWREIEVDVTVGAVVLPHAIGGGAATDLGFELADVRVPAERAGKGSRFVPGASTLPQDRDPCLDCTVLFFNVSTRRPPVLLTPAVATVPLGPGKLG